MNEEQEDLPVAKVRLGRSESGTINKCMDLMALASVTLTSKLAPVINQLNAVASTVWKGFVTMASQDKVPRLLNRIGTHSGVFHCDEALACFMLKHLPEYRDAEIVRTRDLKVLETCDIVVDVGGEYNPKTHRYDHHQRGFEHTISTVRPDLIKNKKIKLSSAGLVYAHFGMEVLSTILQANDLIATSECLQCIYGNIYDCFVEELDAIDNGVPMCADGRPCYRINTHLSARVHKLNPEWNAHDNFDLDKLFRKAMEMVGKEFTSAVLMSAKVWWPARDIVKKSLLARKNIHPSGEIVLIEGRCPWKDHLYSLEEELGIGEQIKFCIFNDKSSDSWRVQGIPVQPDSFICRVFLHSDWQGVRDDKLSEISGIKDCVFCHSTGFIGGNKSKEGAVQMALKSLEASRINKS